MELFLAHTYQIAQSEFPVFGTPSSALLVALFVTAFLLIGYLIIDQIPKPTKNRISVKNEPTYVKVVMTMLSIAMISVGWDVWWHRAVGRDSLFIAPHIGLYVFIALCIGVSFYVWRHTRDHVWKHLVFVLLFIPVSAVFDNYFHTLWGVENYSSPSRFSWSPGHALLAISAIVSLGLLLQILVKFRKTPDFNVFGNLAFGGIFSLLLVLALPFHPTEAWGQIAGFAGAGVISAVYVLSLFTAEYTMRGKIDATLTGIFSLIFIMVTLGKETAPQIMIMPHDRPPLWLVIFAILIPAMIMDLTKNRFPLWIRGLFVGGLWSAILFGFSTQFFAPQFQYGLAEITMAIIFSALAGLTIASLFSILHLDDEKHIEKLLKKW